MEEITSCYPEEVQESIWDARKEYTKKNCKVLELVKMEEQKIS
jgi:hypothetical protein